MKSNILEAVNNAREFFGIGDYPGDFFSRLDKVDYINKYGILLFKEDIDKKNLFMVTHTKYPYRLRCDKVHLMKVKKGKVKWS